MKKEEKGGGGGGGWEGGNNQLPHDVHDVYKRECAFTAKESPLHMQINSCGE